MRVVFDTNVLISAFLIGRRLRRIGTLIAKGKVTPCFTEATREELETVLNRRKFAKRLTEQHLTVQEVMDSLLERGVICEAIFPTDARISDPDDVVILAAAVSCKAECIVSGDRHLLALHEYRGIPIVSPATFLKLTRRQ